VIFTPRTDLGPGDNLAARRSNNCMLLSLKMTNPRFRTVNINNLRSSDIKNSILNDITPSARSCITYEWGYLTARLELGAVTHLPNDVADLNLTPANHCRLESVQTVMKSVPDSSSMVFSRMFKSSEDIKVTLGKDIEDGDSELIQLRHWAMRLYQNQ
jgi:hypothetical protein